MAQKAITTLVDDLTGETIDTGAGGTVLFAFDGATYEIDLTNDNAVALRDAFSPYTHAGRRRARGATSTAAHRTDPEELARIRAWATEHGHEVSTRGRISETVRDAYDAVRRANGQSQQAEPTGGHPAGPTRVICDSQRVVADAGQRAHVIPGPSTRNTAVDLLEMRLRVTASLLPRLSSQTEPQTDAGGHAGDDCEP